MTIHNIHAKSVHFIIVEKLIGKMK